MVGRRREPKRALRQFWERKIRLSIPASSHWWLYMTFLSFLGDFLLSQWGS